jgi:hypothetical protein
MSGLRSAKKEKSEAQVVEARTQQLAARSAQPPEPALALREVEQRTPPLELASARPPEQLLVRRLEVETLN